MIILLRTISLILQQYNVLRPCSLFYQTTREVKVRCCGSLDTLNNLLRVLNNKCKSTTVQWYSFDPFLTQITLLRSRMFHDNALQCFNVSESMLLYAILGYVPLIVCTCYCTRDLRKNSKSWWVLTKLFSSITLICSSCYGLHNFPQRSFKLRGFPKHLK